MQALSSVVGRRGAHAAAAAATWPRATLGGRTLLLSRLAPSMARGPLPSPPSSSSSSSSAASPPLPAAYPSSSSAAAAAAAPLAMTDVAGALGGASAAASSYAQPRAGSATTTAGATAAAAAAAAAPSAPKTDENIATLSFELVQGNIVRFLPESQRRAAPTAVLVHGILGSRRNLASFAHTLVEAFPSWQVLLVDLRCHGESAASSGGGTPPDGPHSVATAARDVLGLLRSERLFPHMLIGHSFGGKVVMSMAQQFAEACNPNDSSSSSSSSVSSQSSMDGGGDNIATTTTTTSLPRPVQVWVLDTLPGEVRQGDISGSPRAQRPASRLDDLEQLLEPPQSPEAAALLQQQRRDHPADLIQALRLLPTPVPSRNAVLEHLTRAGFSAPVARWMTTNLRPAAPGGSASRELAWTFDVEGLADMYRSYEAADLWPLLERPPQGLRVDFVRAEGSTFRWAGPDRGRLEALGHRVHVLRNSGHWVHADNPMGLVELMSETFRATVDLRVRRSPAPSPQPPSN